MVGCEKAKGMRLAARAQHVAVNQLRAMMKAAAGNGRTISPMNGCKSSETLRIVPQRTPSDALRTLALRQRHAHSALFQELILLATEAINGPSEGITELFMQEPETAGFSARHTMTDIALLQLMYPTNEPRPTPETRLGQGCTSLGT